MIVPIIVRESVGAMNWFPKIGSSSDDAVRVFDPPWTLDVECEFADRATVAIGHRAKVQDSHIRSAASGGHCEANEVGEPLTNLVAVAVVQSTVSLAAYRPGSRGPRRKFLIQNRLRRGLPCIRWFVGGGLSASTDDVGRSIVAWLRGHKIMFDPLRDQVIIARLGATQKSESRTAKDRRQRQNHARVSYTVSIRSRQRASRSDRQSVWRQLAIRSV